MWSQPYLPLGSLVPSTLVAALPVVLMLVLLGVLRKPAWMSGLSGCLAAFLLAVGVYHMPFSLAMNTALYGAAYGLLPIGWIVFTALLLYRLAVETGKFEIIKDSIGHLTTDSYMQVLLIAFAFGAFIEGASGFGTPVAVAAATLAGLGLPPFFAASICLLANTSPVAFGAIATPIVMLQTVTSLPVTSLAANVGRMCAPISLFVPLYLVAVMGGRKAIKTTGVAALICGVAFAVTQAVASSSPLWQLTDILSSIVAMLAMVVICRVRKSSQQHVPGARRYTTGQVLLAWSPYIFLVISVALMNLSSVKALLNHATWVFGWPGLDKLVIRVPPLVAQPTPYAASYTFNPLTATGTAALYAVIASAIVLKVSPAKLLKWTWQTMVQLALPTVTIVSVLALAFLMNYSGATVTLGLSFAATGAIFPFFSSLLGWIGVFLTGSDTSANALFGSLQVVTANKLALNPALIAAANSSGGVMGKMISIQSIAVATAATGMSTKEEGKLMRFTLKHSILLASANGLLALIYAYVLPNFVR